MRKTNFDKAESERQMILDYANKHETVTPTVLSIALGLARTTISRHLYAMDRFGEVERVETMKPVYRAKTDKTRSATDCAFRDLRELQKTRAVREAALKRDGTPGRIVHLIDDDGKGRPRMPIPSQGGQGALRARVWAAGSDGVV
jgi:hypothetical protein